jgi:hypothetical protein
MSDILDLYLVDGHESGIVVKFTDDKISLISVSNLNILSITCNYALDFSNDEQIKKFTKWE